MKKTHYILLIILAFFFSSCEKDPAPVPDIDINDEFYQNYFGIDIFYKIIVYNGNNREIRDKFLKIGDFEFYLETSDKTLEIGKEYTLLHKEESFKFFYSELPIVSITTGDKEIRDDPKISGQVRILERGKELFSSFIGIELRGGVSQYYPKKSYSMELWETEDGSNTNKKVLLGMRDDDDWVLDGMWNEPLRIRDFGSHDIWAIMGRVSDLNPKTKKSIARSYCELFLNGNYQGVYYLSEKFDRKKLDLSKYENQIEGELYKAYSWADAVTYDGISAYDNDKLIWNGYEAKYPDEVGAVDWKNLHDHINFVINSSLSDFNNEIDSRIDVNNAIDYFIFLNLIFAPDNRGKNVYTGKMNRESGYFFLPWDLDGSFGNDWQGERIDVTDKILSNGLFDKLFYNYQFRSGIKNRWKELRFSTLTDEYLIQLFQNNYSYLQRNAIYQREALVPELTQNYSEEEFEYIIGWIERRLAFLDDYFDAL